MQPDTIIPDASNPQSWNRYSYVTNRPIVASDPSGHSLTTDMHGEGGGCDAECLNNLQGNCQPNDADCFDYGGGSGNGYQPPAPILGNLNCPTDNPNCNVDPSDLVMDCSDPAWDCLGQVNGTWEDPAIYLSGGIACLVTGLCFAIASGAGSAINQLGWAGLKLCARSMLCWKYLGLPMASILPLTPTANNSSRLVVIGNMPFNFQTAQELGAEVYYVGDKWTMSGNIIWLLDKIQNGYNIIYSNFPPRAGSVFETETIIQNLLR